MDRNRGAEALSGPLSWFSPSGFSLDMGTIERLERGMSQLEKITLHMSPVKIIWGVGLKGGRDVKETKRKGQCSWETTDVSVR